MFVLIAATGGGTLLLDLLWCLGGVRDMISHLGLEDNKGTRGLCYHHYYYHHLLWVWALKRLRFWAFSLLCLSVGYLGLRVLFCLIDATGVQSAVAAAASLAVCSGVGCLFWSGLVF